MITLREAFKLCDIKDREIVWFCDRLERANIWKWPMTGKEVRQKYDMRRTKVVRIIPSFSEWEYNGILFIIRKEEGFYET